MKRSKSTFTFKAILLITAVVVVILFVMIDINVLGRWLVSFKNSEEYFTEMDSGRTPYISISAAIPVAAEDMAKSVSNTKDAMQCRDSCTYDEKCSMYVHDSVKTKCDLLYDVQGFKRNSDALFTTSSGMKLRDFIGENQETRKYLRFEGHALPTVSDGKLATHQFVKSVHECKNKCLEYKDNSNGKCMAFEYDFKDKSCAINSEVRGKLMVDANKDSYILIN